MQAATNLPQTAVKTQHATQDLTTLRAELNRLTRAKRAFPRNARHYNNLIAQVKRQMAEAYAELMPPIPFNGEPGDGPAIITESDDYGLEARG